MSKDKVLLIDDDMVFGNRISNQLREENYQVFFLNSLIDAIGAIKKIEPDLILLNLWVDGKDSVELITDIRLVAPETPVMFVASQEESDVVQRAIRGGGVHCLTKSVDVGVLVAYIERFVHPMNHKYIQIGSFTLDIQSHCLFLGSEHIKRLSRLEFEMLRLFYLHKNRMVSRREIEELWKRTEMNEHTLYNYIRKLRQLLSHDKNIRIVTLPDGYMLEGI